METTKKNQVIGRLMDRWSDADDGATTISRELLADAIEALRHSVFALAKQAEAAPVGADERKALEGARNAAYPVPNSPHTSVNLQAVANRTAFSRGWEARAAIAPRAGSMEPYGWAYECVQPGTDGKGWAQFLNRERPNPAQGVRNIIALYAAPPSHSKEM